MSSVLVDPLSVLEKYLCLCLRVFEINQGMISTVSHSEDFTSTEEGLRAIKVGTFEELCIEEEKGRLGCTMQRLRMKFPLLMLVLLVAASGAASLTNSTGFEENDMLFAEVSTDPSVFPQPHF